MLWDTFAEAIRHSLPLGDFLFNGGVVLGLIWDQQILDLSCHVASRPANSFVPLTLEADYGDKELVLTVLKRLVDLSGSMHGEMHGLPGRARLSTT